MEAFDDAIGLCTEETAQTVVESIRSERERMMKGLRQMGTSTLAPEVLGCLLAVPEGLTVIDYDVHAAILSRVKFEAVDNRNGREVKGVFPGDKCWPMVHVSFGRTVPGGLFLSHTHTLSLSLSLSSFCDCNTL